MSGFHKVLVALVDPRHRVSHVQALTQAIAASHRMASGKLRGYWIDGGASPELAAWLAQPAAQAALAPWPLSAGEGLLTALSALVGLGAESVWCVDAADPRVLRRLPAWASAAAAMTGKRPTAHPAYGWGTWRDWVFDAQAIGTLAQAQALAAPHAKGDGAEAQQPTAPLDWQAEGLLWRLWAQGPGQAQAFDEPQPFAPAPEPSAAHWANRSVYGSALASGLLEPWHAGLQAGVTGPLQRAMLGHLRWFYEVDARERAPTVALAREDAPRFHALVSEAMSHIPPEVLDAAAPALMSDECRHALFAYREVSALTAPYIDAYDHHRGLARLNYTVHGEVPSESWQLDGQARPPQFGKYRAAVYFHRRLYRQRIAWVEAPPAAQARLWLGGQPVAVQLLDRATGAKAVPPPAAQGLCAAAAQTLDDRKSGQRPLPPGWTGLRARLLVALSALPWVRQRYRGAWVFVDRDVDADDSAEHVYRWVREHHPEIPTWYLLHRDSPDWDRLASEGFRLLAPGFARKLLALQCAHVISSHTAHEFGMDRALYGKHMRFRYTFLQHGVIKDDISHWLNPCRFDRFLTSSPAEFASVVDDDTTYRYTRREVWRTGLPRHDRLLRFAAEADQNKERNWILVMPTWRASLVDDRSPENSRLLAFRQSAYASAWRELLNDSELADACARAGLRLAFMPHANAAPYMEAFDVPAGVEVVRMAADRVQRAFARAALFVTDYSSAAFEVALLRRLVVYYQFDRQSFYNGGHNWRLGYFDYERDGFGPVALDAQAVKRELLDRICDGCRVPANYLGRMEAAMPERDGQACRRAFESIMALG